MTLYNNFLLKRGVGLFSRVGLFSGDYGIFHDPYIYINVRTSRNGFRVNPDAVWHSFFCKLGLLT